MGTFRSTSIADISLNDDLTYSKDTNLLWALAQMSTGIVVACLPHLRPAFDKILPSRLTRGNKHIPTNTRSSTHNEQGSSSLRTPRQDSISVTTRIEVGNAISSPGLSAPFHDGHQEPWAPAFEVAGPRIMPEMRKPLCCDDPRRANSCCCLGV